MDFPVLLPVLDLANHDPKVGTTWRSDAEGCSFIRHEEVGAGEEVCNNYGRKGNEECEYRVWMDCVVKS